MLTQFRSNRRRFVLDVESTSTVDLRKAGASAYWAHPDTQIIVACWRIDGEPPWTWRPGDPVPYHVPDLGTGGWRVVAHNWLFEWNCWVHKLAPLYGWPLPPMEVWDCTMARAAFWGLPSSLEQLCLALGVKHVKDAVGHALMLRMARPRATWPLTTWWHEDDPAKLDRLIEYCRQDVLAECDVDDALPDLPPDERDIFLLDGHINQRGIRVDLELIGRLQELIKGELARLNQRVRALTDNRVTTTNQVSKLREELETRHLVQVPNLDKAAVGTALQCLDPVQDTVAHALLTCRAEAAKSSTSKLAAMVAGVSPDGRCRGLLQYGGAGRTMRWAGRRVQPQNFTRGNLKDPDAWVELILAGAPAEDLAMLAPGSLMDLVASLLRPCLVASPGHLFVAADFSQIEARVVAWFAGQLDVLHVFETGQDVYTYAVRKIGGTLRLLGKIMTLGLGFGMGLERFIATAAANGLELEPAAAEEYWRGWRETNPHIVQLWWDVDDAVRQIALAPSGTVVWVKCLRFEKVRKRMEVTLPSGRVMTYHNIMLTFDADRGRDSLSYMGVDPLTKKWREIRTYGGKLVENFVQAFARDIMAHAMRELASRGLRLVLTVHDELVSEATITRAPAVLHMMLDVMRASPVWAATLPLGAEGWIGPRFRK